MNKNKLRTRDLFFVAVYGVKARKGRAALTSIGIGIGKVLVREPSPDVREGENLGTVVLIEFESIDAARKFYESEKYQAAKAVRELAAKAHLVLVEGN